MKVTDTAALILAVAAFAVSNTPLRASETDDRIETSFKTTYVYKTYLKDEHIQIKAKDGVVTLSGSVADENHKPMAVDTAEMGSGSRSSMAGIMVWSARTSIFAMRFIIS